MDPRDVLVGQKRVEGFWLSQWAKRQGVLTLLRLFKRINRALSDGLFHTDIAATFGIDDIRAAAAQAERPARGGKVLLRLTEPK